MPVTFRRRQRKVTGMQGLRYRRLLQTFFISASTSDIKSSLSTAAKLKAFTSQRINSTQSQ